MMTDVMMSNKKITRMDRIKVIIRENIKSVSSFLNGVFWQMLWKLRLAKIYSRSLCRFEIYKKYMDGRCMYCGKVHG